MFRTRVFKDPQDQSYKLNFTAKHLLFTLFQFESHQVSFPASRKTETVEKIFIFTTEKKKKVDPPVLNLTRLVLSILSIKGSLVQSC